MARKVLGEVLDVAGRVEQILGLVLALQSQRCAYRVLQSAILAGPSLDALLQTPIGDLASSHATLVPVVQLCTAFVVESGLTTPCTELALDACRGPAGAPSAMLKQPPPSSAVGSIVCQELERACPAILDMVDLRYIGSRIARVDSTGSSREGELLRSYAQCVPPSAEEANWEVLLQSVQSMAATDAQGAVETCLQKVEQLQGSQLDGCQGRTKTLIEALLGALGPANLQAIDMLLSRAAKMKIVDGGPPGPGKVPFIHGLILNFLLEKRQSAILSGLLINSNAADVEGFLGATSSTHVAALQLLCTYYTQRGRTTDAANAHRQLAEWPDAAAFTLQDRIRNLEMARQASSMAGPSARIFSDEVGLKLELATRVQVPLVHELDLLASNSHLADRWRGAARERLPELKRLQGAQPLYQTAYDFGLFHLVLVLGAMSQFVQEKETGVEAWISLFFPPSSPYCELGEPCVQSLFPLLLVRSRVQFLSLADQPAAETLQASALNSPGAFRARALRLLAELAAASQPGLGADEVAMPPLWDSRPIAALLEYSTCLWLTAIRASSGRDDSRDSEESSSQARQERAWVALEAMSRRPFRCSEAQVVVSYAEMIEGAGQWFQDLHGMVPPAQPCQAPFRPQLEPQDISLHLCEVLLTVVDLWVRQVQGRRGDERLLANFAGAWQGTTAALETAKKALEGLGGGRRAVAGRLLQECGDLRLSGQDLIPAPVPSPPPPRAMLSPRRSPGPPTFGGAPREFLPAPALPGAIVL